MHGPSLAYEGTGPFQNVFNSAKVGDNRLLKSITPFKVKLVFVQQICSMTLVLLFLAAMNVVIGSRYIHAIKINQDEVLTDDSVDF